MTNLEPATGLEDDGHRFCVDAESISRVSTLTDSLRTDSERLESGAKHIGLDKLLPIAGTPFQATDAAPRAEKAVAEIASVNTALQQLSDCMGSLHSEATNRLERPGAGTSSIPNEILSKILLFAVPCSQAYISNHGHAGRQIFYAFQSAVTLSHVSSQFRLVAIHTPALWNRISDSMSPEVVDVCLERSGITHLEIFLGPFVRSWGERVRRYQSFVQTISASSERWSALTLYDSSSRESDAPDVILNLLSSIEVAFASIHAPQLKSLGIHIPERFTYTDLRIPVISTRFCHTWSIPRLHAMVVRQFVPRPFSRPTALRCLDLDLGEHGEGGGAFLAATLDIEALHRFLASCPMLTDLHVSMVRLADNSLASRQEPYALPCVERVSFGFHWCSVVFASAFLETVSFPTASKLNLSLGLQLTSGGELPQFLQVLFNDPSRFPTVSSLELMIECVDSEFAFEGFDTINLPFAFLQNIRHLTFHVDKFVMLPLAEEDRIPPLRSLRLTKCDSIGPHWLLRLLEKLKDQGDVKFLEELRTNSCGMIPDMSVRCGSLPEGDFVEYVRDIILSNELT